MVKRKNNEDKEDRNAAKQIPLPIQIFLWRQTSPFIRPKLGKLYEASCVSFERVFVENKLHGLSPSLSDAISSIPRWQLIQAAFPHVVHCCAALLNNRAKLGHMDKLGNAETKLLHTLQWILLEAPNECLLEMSQEEPADTEPICEPQYSLDSLQLFVYMFAPLIYSVKESDLTFRLANGLRLWQPLWEHRQPDILSFMAVVKPKRNIVRARRHSSLRNGDGLQEDIKQCNDLSVSGVAPLANLTDVCDPSKGRDSKPVNICSVCHSTIKDNSCACKNNQVKSNLDECSTGLHSKHSSLTRFSDVSQATFFDVAVLRCLFSPNWNDEGIQWALTYLLTRLQEITDEKIASERVRHRSCSLPVPQIMVSMVAPVSNVTKKLSLPAFIRTEVETSRKPLPSNKKQKTTGPQLRRIGHGSLGRPMYPVPRLVETYENENMSEENIMNQRCDTESLSNVPSTGAEPIINYKSEGDEQEHVVLRTRKRSRRPPALSPPCIRCPPVLETEEKSEKPIKEESNSEVPIVKTDINSGAQIGLPAFSVSTPTVIEPPKFGSGESGVQEIQNPFLKNLQLTKSKSFDSSKVKPFKFKIDVIKRHTLPPLDSTENRLSTSSSSSGEIPIIRNGGVGAEREVKLFIPTVKTHFEPLHRLQRSKPILEEPASITVESEIQKAVSESVTPFELEEVPAISLAVPIPEIRPTLELPPNETDDNEAPSIPDTNKQDKNAERPVEPAASLLSLPPTIPRSSSDSFVDYYRPQEVEEHCEAPGSTYYIQENGQMNYSVILRALHTVITKETNAKICDVSLHIIDTLLNFSVMDTKSEKTNQKSSTIPKIRVEGGKAKLEDKTAAGIEEIGSEDMNVHNLVMETLVCVFRALGCKHGCGEGLRGQAGNILRQQGQNCLNRMYKIDARQFRRYLRYVISTHPLDSIIDFLHAFLGFCVDPKPKPLVFRPGTGPNEGIVRGGFATNFGSGIAGTGVRGIQGTVVGCIFKALVTRLANCEKELYTERESLYCEVRQMLNYIKEAHGGVFRRVAFSGLIDSSGKGEQSKDQFADKKDDLNVSSRSGSERSLYNFAKMGDGDASPRTELRQNIFRRKFKGSAGQEDDSQSNSKPKFSVFQFAQVVTTWKKKTHLLSPDDHDGSEERTKKEGSRFEFTRNKKEEPHFFSKFRKNKKKDDGKGEDGSDTPKSIDENSDPGNTTIEKERKPVDKMVITAGMKRLAFLMGCCYPGSVPDPEFLAAALDLNAPVVARAALFLECCRFVHSCNKGEWPEWVKGVKVTRPRAQSGVFTGRSLLGGSRRTAASSVQRNTAKMFYLWGEAIGSRLDEIERKESGAVISVVGRIRMEAEQKKLRKDDDDEDFLDEATVNPQGSACPHSLKMVACQLLMEISAFFRDTYQYLPKVRKASRGGFGVNNRNSEFLDVPPVSYGQRKNTGSSATPSPPVHPPRSLVHPVDSFTGSVVDKRISFAVSPLPDEKDSPHSSNTELNITDESRRERVRKPSTSGEPIYHRKKGVASPPVLAGLSPRIRPESIIFKKNRKVSAISVDDDSCETSSVFSDQSPQDQDTPDYIPPPNIEGLDDIDFSKNMPWIKVVVEITSKANFICNHRQFCHPNCYERQKRNCYRLMKAVRSIYGEENLLKPKNERDNVEDLSKRFDQKSKRKGSNNHTNMLRGFSESRRESKESLLDRQPSVFHASRANSFIHNPLLFPLEPERPRKEDSQIMQYLKTQALYLWHTPFALLAKAAPILTEDIFQDILPLAWELLLDTNQELAGASAAIVLMCSAKIPDATMKMITNEMEHEDSGQRVDAIQRFAVLWHFRYQVWPRMEEKASYIFRVSPPSIDFTLPSPTIGMANIPVIAPPWMPESGYKLGDKVSTEEVTRSFTSVAVSRTNQRQEQFKRTMQREAERKRKSRETYHLTTAAVPQQAAYEPSHHTSSDDEDDTIPLSMAMSARRVSIAPPPSANSVNRARSMSIRRASLWSGGTATGNNYTNTSAGDDDAVFPERFHHNQPTFQLFFPSCICSTLVHLIRLLDDGEVNAEGIAVGEVAGKVLWSCLVEEPALILRYILEKITIREKQEEIILLLKKLLTHVGELPPQTAHTLFNYLLGFLMYTCRTPHSGASEAIANALSIIWRIIPYVVGVTFKDLKQTLKKEQCDPTVLISANVPYAKKVIIHGPDESDIPTQLPVNEDMQFHQILEDCLEFYHISPDQQSCHFLVDKKTNQMLAMRSYVRDFYMYKRMQSPELKLQYFSRQSGIQQLQRQAFTNKLAEIGRVSFTLSTLRHTNPSQMPVHIAFLHGELMRLPSFPRKALDAEFDLYRSPALGKELFGLDVIHKLQWVKLISTMFSNMSPDFAWGADMQLFLNVINGALLLHCEDMSLLRVCLATYINIAKHFKQIFATKGYQSTMPTIMRIYSAYNCNPMVTSAIEYTCKQFYKLHMKPFILQMFGSAAPLLIVEKPNCHTQMAPVPPGKVSARCLFKLLLSLEGHCEEPLDGILDIMELVTGEKPLKTLDFIYSGNDQSNEFSILEAIRLCVVVVAYSPETSRSAQMLSVLDAIIPLYLEHIQSQTVPYDNPTAQSARAEAKVIKEMAVCVRALIVGAEAISRGTNGPSRKTDSLNTAASFKSSSHSRSTSLRKQSKKLVMIPQSVGQAVEEELREDFKIRYNYEHVNMQYSEEGSDDIEAMNEYRKPRDMLLSLVSQFFAHSVQRSKELRLTAQGPDIFDQRCHFRLAEIACCLLKVVPHDPVTMGCKGLQKYITKMIPIVDWYNEDLRPALTLILRRLDKLFTKINKKPALMRLIDWESAANFLKGIYIALQRKSIIAHLPNLRSLLNICLALLLSDGSSSGGGDGQPLNLAGPPSHEVRMTPPAVFSTAVIRTVATQMHCMKDTYTLEQVFGGMPVFSSQERTESILLNLILPLILRVGCSRKDSPKIREKDVSFALSMIIYALLPPNKQRIPTSTKHHHHHASSFSDLPSHSGITYRDPNAPVSESLYEAAFLGLKIMIVCFEKQLGSDWYRISNTIKEMGSKMLGGDALWSFLDFVLTVRTPLYIMLQPYIAFKMLKMICETEAEITFQQYIAKKLRCHFVPQPKSKRDTLTELAQEVRYLRDHMYVPRDHTKMTDEIMETNYQSKTGRTPPFLRKTSLKDRFTRKTTIRTTTKRPKQSTRRVRHSVRGGRDNTMELTEVFRENLEKPSTDTVDTVEQVKQEERLETEESPQSSPVANVETPNNSPGKKFQRRIKKIPSNRASTRRLRSDALTRSMETLQEDCIPDDVQEKEEDDESATESCLLLGVKQHALGNNDEEYSEASALLSEVIIISNTKENGVDNVKIT
ncbi:protein unc-80 homolog isoform X2 [Antedon mediterranea]|uniref:protein unc-80 homolog isoform X2 n=1 Tax=Antedon mediterranea TaxID=105859 RepID=UPI003AF526E0